jgi:hypothetical protein
MAAEIVGIEKINKYISKFDFQKIKLSKGTETLYIKRAKEGEAQADLVEDFNEWVTDFIEDNNFRDYKLELFGTYSTEVNAKLSPVVKVVVAFHHREATATAGAFRKENYTSTQPVDVEKYIAVATENATLKAQIDRLEEKMDEILADEEEEEEEVGAMAPQTITEAINGALIGKIDTIVDVVLGMLANRNKPAENFAINGIPETDQLLVKFREVHPEIDEDIARFYKLATEQPQFFVMVIQQLRKMV